jgi:hypothetical protein
LRDNDTGSGTFSAARECSSAGADKPTPGGPNCLQKWTKK